MHYNTSLHEKNILNFLKENKGVYFEYHYLMILFSVPPVAMCYIINNLLASNQIKYAEKNNQSMYGIIEE